MQPAEYYQNRLTSLEIETNRLLKKKSMLAWFRFSVIAVMFISWYFLMPYGVFYVIISSVLLAILFTRIVFADLKNKSSITHHKQLVLINENEVRAHAYDYYHFNNGAAFSPKEHAYANDLDIFGHASLFQYINRTSSEMGAGILAHWLLTPSTTEIILQRQEAIKELSRHNEWRQKLQALGNEKKIENDTEIRLQNWFNEDDRFINSKVWLSIRILIPALVLTVIALNITDVVGNYFRNYCLLASALLALYVSKKVGPIHQMVSKMTDELDVLTGSIQLIEKTIFSTPYLNELQIKFKSESEAASVKLRQLKKILERLDLRFNFVISIPLNILLQWDLQQVIALEKWKQKNHENVSAWFNALAQLEAVSSLATLAFNHPDWVFPVFNDQHFFINAEEMGHPLIKVSKRVNNYIKIDHAGEIMLVTGSNMAGKSTYLRSVGVNTVMAMAGAPVCATYFCLSPVQIVSSMRIADNLEESTSTFYAELKKLKIIIDKVSNKEKVFILLDEILRGTNSLDRHTGSEALIKQLIKNNAACVIATHDVELAGMKQEYPDNILNYHFDVQVDKDELYFDYALKQGVCTSLNASILMRKIGIEL